MAMDNQDILLDTDFEDKVVDGDFAVGDGILDDCNIILKLNTGALKSDVVIGPNLIRLMNSNISPTQFKQEIKLHLNRDGKYPKKLEIVEGNINIEM
jgi:hypothetical protein